MNNQLVFKLGTRGSPLALWQAERVKSLLLQAQPELHIEIVIIHTTGDKILDKPLIQVGGKGIFTKEIENAMLAGEIDFAVHSFKDLPTVLPEGLAIVAIPERSEPMDAILSRGGTTLATLPPNPTIATGSLRRRAQVRIARPDSTVVDIRGNVNTRLRKFYESPWDALIMAHAGLVRMEWQDRIGGVLPLEEMIPAPAQGALAIEARKDDTRTQTLLSSIHDPQAAQGVWAERAFLATLEGGCQVPMGAFAQLSEQTITLHGFVSNLDGSIYFRESLQGPHTDPSTLGIQLAQHILARGGQAIIEDLKSNTQTR
ncbi:MAG: hydroxymethylbilane synthase [bacterium]|jgi:hydroxymethylbilane synthase|nr:hydroxymethylbilane synthase [bacterium]